MTQVNVLDSGSTDPNELAEGRDTTIRRDATRTRESATLPRRTSSDSALQAPPPAIEESINAPGTQDLPVPDSDALAPSTNPLVPRSYPNVPANVIPPVPLDLSNTMGDQDTINSILRQSGAFALQDDIQLNHDLQNLLNSGVPFGPQQPLYQPPDISIPEFAYPQLIEDAVEYRANQAASTMTPVGVDKKTGQIIPGARNALSGTPLSEPVREGLGAFLFGNIGTSFDESLPDNILYKTHLSPVRNFEFLRDVVQGFGAAFGTNQFRRFASRLDPTGISKAVVPQTPRFTANLGTIASRVVDPTSELAQREIDTGEESFGEALVNNSLVARDVFEGLATTPGTNGVNILQGQFGDFGNAGVLSGLLYLANLPEGIASGALYEISNFAIDTFTDWELSRDRVRLFDAFRGRDLGFMQEADDSRYLSFMGEQGLLAKFGVRNPVLQGTIGFITDVAWGGFTDFGTNQIARVATRNIIDPAVARALPDSPPSVARVLNQEGASAVVNLNRVIDDAIEARRLNPLPRIQADPSLRRTLPIKADGVTLSTRFSRLGDLTREVFVTRPTNLLDNIRVNRLTEIETDLADLQESIIRNNLSSSQARQALETVDDIDSPLTTDIIDTQLAVIRNADEVNQATQRQITNLIGERRDLALTSGNLRQVVARELQEAIARGSIELDGDVIRTLNADSVFDELLPVIPQVSIQPSVPVTTTLRQYRIDPTSVKPHQLSPVRRNDQRLTDLAKFHNLVPNNFPTLSPRQLSALRLDHPTLLPRYGNPIDLNLSLPVKRIQLSPADPIPQVRSDPSVPSRSQLETSFIPDVPPPVIGEIELDPISKRTINSLSNRAERILKQLENPLDVATETRLFRQLDNIERRINRVFANAAPDSVDEFYVESLPLNRTPVTPESVETAMLLSRAEAQFRESTTSARALQQQLIDAQRILDEQGKYLEELPPFERTTLQNEVATRNNYTSGGVPLIAPASAAVDNPTTVVKKGLKELSAEFDNFIPLSRVRQLPGIRELDRAAQDDLLFQLSRNDDIDLSTAVETANMTNEELAASIRPLVDDDLLGSPPISFVVTNFDEVDDIIEPRIIIDSPPSSLQSHIDSDGSWYHGTKSLIKDLTTVDLTKGSSVSNELGPGLYLTTDPNLAREFAKAHPAVDRIPNPSLRYTDVGRVHQLIANPDPMARIINADVILPKDSPVRRLFHDNVRSILMRSLPEDASRKLMNNVTRITRTKPYRDWFQSLRINWNRISPDSQTQLSEFNSLFINELSVDLGVYGASHKHIDGHFTLAVYDNTGLSELNRIPIGVGSLEEQRLSRYSVDLFAHNEFNNATTRSNLAASALAVDQQAVNNLKQAAKEAYQQSLDDTEAMLRVDTRLQNQVARDKAKQISDIQRTGPDSASTQLRRFRGENSSPCV